MPSASAAAGTVLGTKQYVRVTRVEVTIMYRRCADRRANKIWKVIDLVKVPINLDCRISSDPA